MIRKQLFNVGSLLTERVENVTEQGSVRAVTSEINTSIGIGIEDNLTIGADTFIMLEEDDRFNFHSKRKPRPVHSFDHVVLNRRLVSR